MLILAVIAVVSFSSFGLAADYSGSVVSVLDGDTIEVLHNNRAERANVWLM
jgi:endonuclease YncB( thermonuclease family)